MLKPSKPNLAEVQRAFRAWRQSGQTRITPPALRAQAVSLLAEYSITEVKNALQVDYRQLSRWRREVSALETGLPDTDFVELPAAMPEPQAVAPVTPLTLTRHAADGSAVSIRAELSEAQWRWALRLLQETGS
jgi:hypothetical protein